MRPSWTFELLSLAGTPQAPLVPTTARITRRLNGTSSAEITLDPGTVGAELVTSTAHLVRCWRRGPSGGTRTLRLAGRISGAPASCGVDEPDTITLTVHDPTHLLNFRLRASQVSYASQTPRAIMAALVAAEDARAPIHLRVAAGTGGPNRDRTYEAGKNVGEILDQLAEVQNGFHWVCNPVPDDADPAVVGELVLRHPDPGQSRPAARLEFGEGTIGNLTQVQVTALPPINRVTGFGAGDGDEQLVVAEQDAGSIAASGLFEASVQHVDVVIEQTLRDHATDALRPEEPRRAYTLSLASPGAVVVPLPWDDFDVGDTLPVLIRSRSPLLAWAGEVMVTEYTASVDDSGNEILTGIEVVTL